MTRQTKLALHGGRPARSRPLPPNFPGAVVMGEEEAGAVGQVIRAQSPFRYYGANAQYAVRRLERQMADTLGAAYALGVSSGTAALIVALRALGVGYGDKVIVPANTFAATAGAVVCCNAVPVFADIDDTLNISPASLEAVIDDEVRAVIVVPILGVPCDMDPIMEVARRRGVKVIEDVAQSCGVAYKGRLQGTIGDVGAFSFQMNKVITAGEGGAVVTNDPAAFERAVRYHDQGAFREKEQYGIESVDEQMEFIGQNYRMSDIAGAVMLEQWGKLSAVVANMRRVHSAICRDLRRELPGLRLRRSPDEAGGIGSNLGIILPDRERTTRFIEALQAENIGAHVLYLGRPVYKIPRLFHQRTVERDNFPFNYPFRTPVRYEDGLCPNAESLIPRTVFIPISPLLTEKDGEEIVEGIVKVYEALRPDE